MKTYCKNLKSYFDDLAARQPAPGGGSAAAAIFCTGVGLIEMALQYSLKEDKSVIKEFTVLRKKNFPVIDLDAKLFAQIMKAKGAKRDALIAKSERMIADLGLSVIKAAKMAKGLRDKVKISIISDYLIGLDCLRVVLSACVFNLKANASMFKITSRYIGIFENELNIWPKS